MTKKEILEQVRLANEKIQDWPEWERNILEHSLQPTNTVARTPVDNRVARAQVTSAGSSTDTSDSKVSCRK